MKIVYSDHLIFRMKLRNIPDDLPMRVFLEPDERFYDSETRHVVVVKKIADKDGEREFVVAFEEAESEIRLITIHPLKPYQKERRIQSGRWRKL